MLKLRSLGEVRQRSFTISSILFRRAVELTSENTSVGDLNYAFSQWYKLLFTNKIRTHDGDALNSDFFLGNYSADRRLNTLVVWFFKRNFDVITRHGKPYLVILMTMYNHTYWAESMIIYIFLELQTIQYYLLLGQFCSWELCNYLLTYTYIILNNRKFEAE